MWTWIQRLVPFDLNSSAPETADVPPPHAGDGTLRSGQVQVSESPGAASGRGPGAEEGPSFEEERTNAEWIAALKGRNQGALETLRNRLSQGLLAALRRAAPRRRVPRRTEALARESAREALEQILDKLDAFRKETGTDVMGSGERRFTTWAQKIAVHIAFRKLRRDD